MPDQEILSELRMIRKELATIKNDLVALTELSGQFGIAMQDNTVFVQTRLGHRFYIPAEDYSITPKMIGSRVWEPRVTSAVMSIIKPGMKVIDVGANFGYYSCLAGSLMRQTPNSQVFAIEPNPEMLRLLERNIYINWSMSPIHVMAVAVADTPGERDLFVPKGLPGQASLTPPTTGLDRNHVIAPELECHRTKVDTLDRLFPAPFSADLIKIDVEGEEIAVLEGARDLIARSPNLLVVLEWALDHQERSHGRAQQVWDYFKYQGFVARHIENKLTEISEAEAMGLSYGNFLFKREPSA